MTRTTSLLVSTLLHISDLHFGPPHRPRVAQGVLDLIAARKPGVVVISGDLTQRARSEQFHQARAFVDQIQVPVVVVPGNHDVPLYNVWQRLVTPYAAYQRHFAHELEPTYRDERVMIVGLNTAHGWTIKDGRIPLRRLAEVAEQLAAVPETVFKVVVAHHHFIPPPNFGTQSVLDNAYQAIELFSSVGVDLILGGHLHQAYIGSSEEFYPRGRPPVVILHSGTTTSSRGRGSEREKNTCNWIHFDDDTLQVTRLAWFSQLGRFVDQSRHLYPRQERSLYTLEDLDLTSAL